MFDFITFEFAIAFLSTIIISGFICLIEIIRTKSFKKRYEEEMRA